MTLTPCSHTRVDNDDIAHRWAKHEGGAIGKFRLCVLGTHEQAEHVSNALAWYEALSTEFRERRAEKKAAAR